MGTSVPMLGLMGSGRQPRAAAFAAALAVLGALLALAAAPAHAARLRAYGVSTGARSYTLVVGRSRLAVSRRHVTRQLVIAAGPRTLVARDARGRRLARLSLRVAASNAFVVTLVRDPSNRWRLVASPEGPAEKTSTTFHVTNLANPAASQGVLVLEEQFDAHRLVVARSLGFGRSTLTLRIAPNAASNGSARIIARRTGGPMPLASVVLPLATRYTASYFVVPHGKSIAIEQLPGPIVPLAARAPTVSGVMRLGQTLTCSPGSWRNVPKGKASLQWLRGTHPIAGATSTTYRLTSADAGQFIACLVIARRGIYTVRTHSTAKFLQGVPVLIPGPNTAVKVDGISPDFGTPLTCVTAAANWTGLPDSFSYSWLRGPTLIAGQTTTVYTLGPLDNGRQVRCRVVAHGPGGDSSATLSQNWVVVGGAPQNITSPRLIAPPGPPPTVNNSQSVTCKSNIDSEWANLPVTITFKWFRDASLRQTDPPRGGAGDIPSSYALTTGDIGHTISCHAFASNDNGDSAEVTAPATYSVPNVPVNIAQPQYTVDPTTIAVGDTETCTSDLVNDWSPAATSILYRWTRNGVNILNATTNQYTLAPADDGKTVRCVVNAVNDGGISLDAVGPAITLPQPPISTGNPDFIDVSTDAAQEFLLISAGSWSGGSIDTYTVVWTANVSGSPGHQIGTCSGNVPSDLTTCAWVVGAGDTNVTMTVTATNRGGSPTASASGPVPAVPGGSPSPSISVGASTINFDSTGTWTPTPTYYTVQWIVGTGPGIGNPGGTCAGINVSSCTYTPDGSESGQQILARVTAYNAGGASAPVDSNQQTIP